MGIFEVFYAPGRLFSSLPERKGAWVVPFVLNALLVTAIVMLLYHYVGRETVMRRQLENFHMPPDRMEEAISRQMSSPEWRSYIGPFLSSMVLQLIIAGLLYAFALMSKNTAKYIDQLAMVSFAYFPYYLVVSLMSALILMATPDPGSLNLDNLIATNVGAFLNKAETSKGVYSLASSLDLLSFAEIGLLAYGFSKVNRAKLAYGLAAVVGIWILYVSVKLGLSSLF